MKKTFYTLAAITAIVITTVVVSNLSWAQGPGQQSEITGNYPPRPQFDSARHEAMTEAMTNGDYEAWVELTAGKGPAEVITEETFPRLVEAWQLMQAGQYEEARAIHEELGLNKGWGKKSGFGQGQGCQGGCHGQGFVDANNNGVCDLKENR